MDRHVIWLPAAVQDVDEIAAYIARDSSAYASAVVQKILISAANLGQFSERGHVVPEWDDSTVREVHVYQWRLIYQVHSDRITILTVIHGARLLGDRRTGLQ